MPTTVRKGICPHLGLSHDPTVATLSPTEHHRCYLSKRVVAPTLKHQESHCLGSEHVNCQLFAAHPDSTQPQSAALPLAQKTTAKTHWSHYLVRRVAGAFVLALLFGAAYLVLAILQVDRGQTLLIGTSTPNATLAEATATISVVVTPSPPQSTTTAKEVAMAAQSTPAATSTSRFMTPTPEPGGTSIQIKPKEGLAGWWSNNSTLRNHLGDSFLYAGAYEGKSYIAGIRFDLSMIPRGAPITYAQLRLTGLRDDHLVAGADATWLVQLIPENSLIDLVNSDFLTFYSAPASITLLPELHADNLGIGVVNSWELDQAVRQWLAQQLLDGASSVTVRISAASQNGDTVFAWDSGLGPESGGDAATLLLSIGLPPPTVPPLPTKPMIVATLTPVPQNVLTVVAQASTATVEAYAFGTRTPFPYQVVTPTPQPENLATVQVIAIAQDLPPVVLNTPVPANEATAIYNAEYATAVALTTGTFTPVPPNYVTPVLVYPSPPAENVATAAARVIEATQVAQSGAATPTPPPYNAVMAVYAFATETPSNIETAQAMVREQNAAAATTGTPTPTPWNLFVITAVPLPTPTEIPLPTALPLIVSVDVLTATPSPTPTRIVSVADLEQFNGKILFLSDRAGTPQVWVMDPTTGEVLSWITDSQLMDFAREQMLSFSPNRQEQAVVQVDNNGDLQIKILALQYGTTRQITHFREKLSYDPAWSPRGDKIVFVSTNSGNDEIYLVDLDGHNLQQLTSNTWEWDKHPSWSPDASQIVFYSNRDSGRTQIWVMNADGSGQRNLSNNEYNDWDPVWIR